MQHGQKITGLPKQLLAQAGFTVKDLPEGHLCCGSAGTYNLLQPEIAGQLRDRKVANIESTAPAGDRHRQYRLHHPDRLGHRDPGRAHGRAAGLGHRRAEAGGAGVDRAQRVCDGRHESVRWPPSRCGAGTVAG